MTDGNHDKALDNYLGHQLGQRLSEAQATAVAKLKAILEAADVLDPNLYELIRLGYARRDVPEFDDYMAVYEVAIAGGLKFEG